VTKDGRPDVVVYVVWVLAIRDVGRIYAETNLVSLGTLRARYVDGKLPVKPDVKREVKGETLVIGHTDIVLQNVYV
jgi:hypothetical protein